MVGGGTGGCERAARSCLHTVLACVCASPVRTHAHMHAHLSAPPSLPRTRAPTQTGSAPPTRPPQALAGQARATAPPRPTTAMVTARQRLRSSRRTCTTAGTACVSGRAARRGGGAWDLACCPHVRSLSLLELVAALAGAAALGRTRTHTHAELHTNTRVRAPRSRVARAEPRHRRAQAGGGGILGPHRRGAGGAAQHRHDLGVQEQRCVLGKAWWGRTVHAHVVA